MVHKPTQPHCLTYLHAPLPLKEAQAYAHSSTQAEAASLPHQQSRFIAPHVLPPGFSPSYYTKRPITPREEPVINLVSSDEDDELDSASFNADPLDFQDDQELAPSTAFHTSEFSEFREVDREEEKTKELAFRGPEAHTKALLSKLRPLTNDLIIERGNKDNPSFDLGQWAEVGVSCSKDPHLAFASSKTIDCEFRKALADRFNQSHAPKGVPLLSPRGQMGPIPRRWNQTIRSSRV